MKLSVIIVNFNNCNLLKQAINSLMCACKSIDYELMVVDNGSADRTLEMLGNNFPEVRVLENSINVGLAKASNQALRETDGDYVLLTGADTICNKDTVDKILSFMDAHADAGGASVRMVSPQGKFIPESLHGLSPAWAAFLKFIGFAKNLSKTRLYDRKRKDWVDEFQISEIDILNSGFMMVRRSAINEAGLFDERFFIAGHNIDLSYRIRLAGFKNYYFPKTYIINYETQQKDKLSWNYLKHFYGAMFIFAVKYLFRMPEIKIGGIPQLIPSSYEVK